jgi:hypothetical protein
VGLIGGLIAGCYVSFILITHGWDPTILLAEGDSAPIQAAYAEEQLGREIARRPQFGHDGKFFFAQANDPWYLHPDQHAIVLDLPVYRAQRMLYPTIASGFGLFPPTAVVWSMVVTNIVAVVLGASLTAMLASTMGASRWLGLGFAVNPGVVAELDIDGGGVLALALAIGGLLFLVRNRPMVASPLLAASVLARETMLLFVCGVFLGYGLRRRQWLLLVPLLSGGAALVWRFYISRRLMGFGLETLGGLPSNPVRNLTLAPFTGAIKAADYWSQEPAKFAFSVVLILLMLLFTRRGITSQFPIAWAVLPFVGLAIFLSVFVWREPYDLARAVAPIYTAYPLLLFASREEHVFD